MSKVRRSSTSKVISILSRLSISGTTETLPHTPIDELIVNVRTEFLKIYDENPEHYDECDIETVKNNEFTVKRYILWNKYNADAALKQLDDALKWRKSFGVNTKTINDAPIEFYKLGSIFQCGNDINGLPVVYLRAKTILKIAKLEPIVHILAVGIINKIDIETNGGGFVNVLDLSGVKLKNADLNLIQFVINTLRKYFPLAVSRIIVYNLPWYLRGFVPIVKMWLGPHEQELLRFISDDQLFDYIDKDHVPKYLGGNNHTDFTVVPEGCKHVSALASQYGFTEDDAIKYLKLFEPIIAETQSLVSNNNLNEDKPE